MINMDGAPTLEGTISALEGGVENLPVGTAVSNIKGWQTTLSDAGLTDVASQLDQLATALQAEPVDAEEANRLLASLGSQTTAAAATVTDQQQSDQLTQLGSMLTNLGGGAGTTGGGD